MFYSFLRIFAIPVVLTGYILYQFIAKKKRFSELRVDISYVLMIAAVYFIFYYLLLH